MHGSVQCSRRNTDTKAARVTPRMHLPAKGIHNSAPIMYTLNAPLTKAPTAHLRKRATKLRSNATKAFVDAGGAS